MHVASHLERENLQISMCSSGVCTCVCRNKGSLARRIDINTHMFKPSTSIYTFVIHISLLHGKGAAWLMIQYATLVFGVQTLLLLKEEKILSYVTYHNCQGTIFDHIYFHKTFTFRVLIWGAENLWPSRSSWNKRMTFVPFQQGKFGGGSINSWISKSCLKPLEKSHGLSWLCFTKQFDFKTPLNVHSA